MTSSLVLALPSQATTLKALKYIDSTNTVQFLQNDWNPADGDTHWEAIGVDGMWVGTDPYLLDFFGANVAGSFSVGDDPWEIVSIKSLAGEQLDLRQTQEMQLVARPLYVTSNPFVSVVLRLTMQDGSIWDQPKVLANNVWQTGAFPIKEDAFARAQWGPEGMFDLGKVASWEVILADLPPNNNHHINFRAVYMKGNYDAPQDKNAAEPFGVNFFNGDGSILFRHADWNPADGDTDWLYHIRKQPTSYDPYGFLKAVYRSEGDPWETVSLRKEAQTYFDLTANGNNQIVALVNADLNLDPNALIMSLTMEDGSIWQQGRPLDVVRESGSLMNYADDRNLVSPYRFPLAPDGKGWTMAAWGPTGRFDLSRIKAWELFFNNLGQGEHAVFLGSIDTIVATSLVRAANTFGTTGQARWLERSFSSDGVIADISSAGVGDRLSIAAPIDGSGGGFTLEVTNSYVNPSPDAVVFMLTTKDGKIWQQAYSLPKAGRSVLWIYTTCPSVPPGTPGTRPNAYIDHCQVAMGPLYGINPADITNWEITLNSPPAGEHKIRVNLLSTVN
ncbi:hypothetical protein [Nitrosovibrio tenuis]|nr:hypothetical protein [Nitrosovibrio tenuis]